MFGSIGTTSGRLLLILSSSSSVNCGSSSPDGERLSKNEIEKTNSIEYEVTF